MKVVSLFSGIGGFDVALERLDHTTVAYSEVDPWACSVMAVRFPHASPLGDITKVDWSQVEQPDILCGGFPCQPHSVAGKRLASADERDLWGEFVRAIRELRPRYVIAENVPGLLTSDGGRFFNRVMSDLAALGYDAEWQVLSAADVGAPHRRERVWIVADRDGSGCNVSRCQEQEAAALDAPVRADTLAHSGRGDIREVNSVQSTVGESGPHWPTPRTEDGESTGISATRRALGVADNLPSAVGQWMTPTVPNGGRTPRPGQSPTGRLPDGGKATVDLSHQVGQWATPQAHDEHQGDPDRVGRFGTKHGGRNLNDDVGGKLNPDWVECLMGYPVGWSDPAVPNEALAWTPFPAGLGPQYDWEPPRVTTRKDGRRKRLRCLGNAILPACLEAVLAGDTHQQRVAERVL